MEWSHLRTQSTLTIRTFRIFAKQSVLVLFGGLLLFGLPGNSGSLCKLRIGLLAHDDDDDVVALFDGHDDLGPHIRYSMLRCSLCSVPGKNASKLIAAKKHIYIYICTNTS